MAVRQDASTGEMVDDGQETSDASAQQSTDPTKMHIKVYSPYQTYFDDLAASISAINDTGPFDILKGHHQFLTLLNACELLIGGTEKGEERIKISHGVMYVKEDKVIVFLDV